MTKRTVTTAGMVLTTPSKHFTPYQAQTTVQSVTAAQTPQWRANWQERLLTN